MTHTDVLRRLEDAIEEYGSLRRAASGLSVSPQYLSAVLSEQRGIGPKLLKALKLTRRIVKTPTYEARR